MLRLVGFTGARARYLESVVVVVDANTIVGRSVGRTIGEFTAHPSVSDRHLFDNDIVGEFDLQASWRIAAYLIAIVGVDLQAANPELRDFAAVAAGDGKHNARLDIRLLNQVCPRTIQRDVIAVDH